MPENVLDWEKIPSYVVIEGPDGSGKDTIVDYLEEHNDELNAEFQREPSNITPVGNLIRNDVLSDKINSTYEEQGLLFTTDRYILREKIKNNLSSGENVISNRSFISSLAYQVTDDKPFNRILMELQSRATPPDLVLLTAVDSDTIIERKKKMEDEKEIFEKEDYLRKLPKKYLVSSYITKALFPTTNIKYIDCVQPKKGMKEDALEAVKDFQNGNIEYFEEFTPWKWSIGEQLPSLHNSRLLLDDRKSKNQRITPEEIFSGGLKSFSLRTAVRERSFLPDHSPSSVPKYRYVNDKNNFAAHSVLDGFIEDYREYEDIINIDSKEVLESCKYFFEKHNISRINPAYAGSPISLCVL